MKPHKTLFILLVLMVLLYGPSLFYPGDLRLPGNISISLPDARGLKSYLLPYFQNLKSVDPSREADETSHFSASSDSTMATDTCMPAVSNATSELFNRLLADTTDSQLRILYYGDSQLEGDRLAWILRKRLREKEGGSGPGLLSPTMLVPYTRSSYIRASSNWKKHDYRSLSYSEEGFDAPGPMLAYSTFEATAGKDAEAWVRISPSSMADSLVSVYDKLRIFYGCLYDSLQVVVEGDGELLYEDSWQPSDGPAEYTCSLKSAGDIQIRFRGRTSPRIYGISIESSEGVVLDNISMRGSAGTEFSKTRSEEMRKFYRMLDPELIILQFGLNIVRSHRSSYEWYGHRVAEQLRFLKETCPEAEILVLGVTDMAMLADTGLCSYPNIPAIIRAQQNAAMAEGAYFWDSREAMGGNNAILRWRNEDPPLVSNDYVHLSYAGGIKLGEMLFEAYYDQDRNEEAARLKGVTAEKLNIEAGGERISTFLLYDSDRPLLFVSAGFWIFLLFLLVLYPFVSARPPIRNIYLLFFSLLFYYKTGGWFFILLLISTVSDYFLAILINRSERKGVRLMFLITSLSVNLGMLAFFKYSMFISGVINDVLSSGIQDYNWLAMFSNTHLGTSFDTADIILPVGISFFTFQTISYTIDVYRGKTTPVKNILDFGFYVSFFPQLVAGPIVRASEFVPQLYSNYTPGRREWGHAVFLIINGLIKKIVISDFLATGFIDGIFANPASYSGLANLLSVYAYGLQIYCDFSGYTDIAIGVALLLGFRLPVNFNSPYKANSLSDFWRRWHISLSRWLRDYLYIPLGGNRKGSFRTGINLMLTMLLGGLWHGAAWRFVLWGGMHGAGLVVSRWWKKIFGTSNGRGFVWKAFSVFLTFNFVNLCWIFFRAESMDKAAMMVNQVRYSFMPDNLSMFIKGNYDVMVMLIAGYVIHLLPASVKESYRGLFISLPLAVKMVFIYILALALYNIQLTDLQPFIYFRF